MVAFNESVGNLQEFNALLKESTARLSDETQSLEAEAGALQQCDTRTAGSLDGLNGTLGEMETAFEGQAARAAEEVQQLTAEATRGSESRLPEGQQDIEERAAALEQALARDGAALEGDWSDLQSSGFEPAQSVLASLAAEAESLQQGAEQTFDDADGQLSAARGDAAAADSAVEGAAGSFAAATDGQQGAAEEVSQVAALLEQGAGELSSTVEALGSELDQAYATLGQEAGQATDEMVAEVASLIDATGSGVDGEARELEQGVTDVGEGAAGQLATVLTQAEALVSAGENVTQPCGTLVPELARCRDIAGDIERLLQSMA